MVNESCTSCRYWARTEKPLDARNKKTQRRLCRRAVFSGPNVTRYPKPGFKCKYYENQKAYWKKKEYEEALEARLMEKSF